MISLKKFKYFLLCTCGLAYYMAEAQVADYDTWRAEKQVTSDRVNSEWAKQQPYVVLLSIDGFRYDYADKFGASNIIELGKTGVTTEYMLSSFPTKTFPNHYTIVTGMYPGNHGIVSNEFYSRSKNEWYAISNPKAVRDGSWYGGMPLWSLAEQSGMLSASMFWVGSEAKIGGYLPSYYYAYDGKLPNEYRTRQLVDWLKLPESKRPHVLFGYFSLVDDMGHIYGPEHEKTEAAVLKIDALIGELQKELKKLNLPVHLVLVSDHGMAKINRGLVLPDLVSLGDSKVAYSFPPMIYQSDPAKLHKMYDSLRKEPLVEVYQKGNIPDTLNFQNEDRVGDLILLTAPPTVLLSKAKPVSGGTHGFNPYQTKEMGALFVAEGPMLKQGQSLPVFQNIHVYPFLCQILGLDPPENIDGAIKHLQPAFKK